MIFAAMSVFLAAISFTSCKKDNKDTPPDNTSLFKNTNWTGEFNYTGKGPEPVSIEFSDGGQLVWRELLANHTGSWTVTGDKLAINLDGSPSFTGTISSNSLTSIQSSDMSGRVLKSAILNKDPIPDLSGTVWGADNVSLKFTSASTLDLIFGPPANTPTYTGVAYTRDGRAIHFTVAPEYVWFTVITAASVMKGTNHAPSDPTVYGFLVTKQ